MHILARAAAALSVALFVFPVFTQPAGPGFVPGSRLDDLSDYRTDPNTRSMMSEDQQAAAEQKAEEIVSRLVSPGMTEFEKTLVLHEYITETMTYGKWNNETNAYTALIHKQADCVGFARGLSLLLGKAGLKNSVIVRKRGHLWTTVTIRDRCYHIDATWSNVKSNWGQYSWFLLSDAQNAKNPYHDLDSGESAPGCSEPFALTPGDYPHRGSLRAPDKRRILGTLSLPETDTAGPGGLLVEVNGNRVLIPEGRRTAQFFASVPRRLESARTLSYTILDLAAGAYVKTGYYSRKGTMIGPGNAEQIDPAEDDAADISFNVIRSYAAVQGTVSIPADFTHERIYVSMELYFDTNKGRTKYLDWISIPADQSSASFKIDVPPGEAEQEFQLYAYTTTGERMGLEKVTRFQGRIRPSTHTPVQIDIPKKTRR